MFENGESYFAEAESYMRPLVTRKYESSWTMYDSHTYPGGCWRIHQLRRLLGDGVFWSGVQKYVRNFRDKVVETSDFRKVFENESGLNLTRFFDEWFYSKVSFCDVKQILHHFV
jgi:aminopeptidase N